MSSQSQDIQVSSGNCQCKCQCSRPDPVPDGKFFQRFPATWDVPDFFMSRWIFKTCCFIFTLHGDLKWLYGLLAKGDNWEQMHGQYLTQLNQVSIVQGLVLATAAVFLSSNPPLAQHVDYISDSSYACLAESLIFSLFGLLFQLKASASGFVFRKREAAEDGRPELTPLQVIIERRWRIFWHLLGLAVPIILFGISVVLMIVAIVLTGFSSHSKVVQIYLSTTFAFLSACHLASILASPFYYHLSKLWVGILEEKAGA
ncbi:hypothetical protein DFH29DRAFT_875637 [Suillus ampliporus]|nr:hypothetical protein DFH29DRAFT_875637 [Suillus ampliporus]